MNWQIFMRRWLTSFAWAGDDSPCPGQRCYSSKGGGNADVVMAQLSAWLEAKLEARAGVHVRHLCCWPVITPLNGQPESSTVHAIGVGHFFIKMRRFITWYFSWMHGWFCFITARKSLHCSSCKRYTWASWAEYGKDGNVSVLKERSSTMTHSPSCLLPLCHGTCNILFTEHGMHYFPNFQQKIKRWVSSLSDVLSKYQKE